LWDSFTASLEAQLLYYLSSRPFLPPLAGILYILIFGIGSIGGMLIMTSLIGLPFIFTANKFGAINEGIKVFAGSLSIVFGFFLVCI